jgi:hypothetical protein
MARSIGEWDFTTEQLGRSGIGGLAQAVAQTSGGAAAAGADGTGARGQQAAPAVRVAAALARGRSLAPTRSRRLRF